MDTEKISEVVSLIDQLVKMSGVKGEASSLKIELEKIEKELTTARLDLGTLKGLMTPERYFNANSAIVSQAIESEIVRRNQSLSLSASENQQELDTLRQDLEAEEEKNQKNNENKARSEECISALQNRLSNDKAIDEETRQYYSELIGKVKENIATFNVEISKSTHKIRTLKEQIAAIEEKLREINNSIENNNKYLEISNSTTLADTQDNPMKARDDKEASLLEERIKELERRRLEILNNPLLIGEEAQKALTEENDITLAMAKIRQLASIVTAKPYMSIPYTEAFVQEMNQKLAMAEEARDTFKNNIESKSYQLASDSLEKEREDYLKNRRNLYTSGIEDIKSLIKALDSQSRVESKTNIANIKDTITTLENDIKGYSSTADLPLPEAEIKSAISDKESEVKNAQSMLNTYLSDTISDSIMATGLGRIITLYELAISNVDDEIKDLESRLKSHQNHESVVERAFDTKTLNDKIKDVMDIKHRMRFTKSPDQIIEEIEKLLGYFIEPTNIKEEPNFSIEKPEENTFASDGLKVDHIIDLIDQNQPTTNLNAQELKADDVSISAPQFPTNPSLSFEPITPIDLSTYSSPLDNKVASAVSNYTEPESKTSEQALNLAEPKRGKKVINITSIDLDKKPSKEQSEPSEIQNSTNNYNPFISQSNNSSFNFGGDPLSKEDEATDIDFLTAADEINLGLGRAA